MAARTPALLLQRAVIVIAVGAILALGAWLYARNWHPPLSAYPQQGVDVSARNGPIDWPSVAASGAHFAYIEATNGTGVRDAAFARNWDEAGATGLKRGAVHRFSACRPAAEQAANFIATVPRDDAALPSAIALDADPACPARDRATLLASVESFIRMVEAHNAQPAILLVTSAFEDQWQISAAVDRPLWLTQRFREPTYGAHPWIMWRASDMRRVTGIDAPVGWNVLRVER